ncbi:MAG TPA: phosphatase PAP2 family protein [Flavisolibacter sp.]|nr:phosphatase PAP2 family protein [Flavisolibacter sp.]
MQTKEIYFQRYIKKLPLAFFLLAAVMMSLLLFAVLAHEVLGEKEDNFDFSVFNYLSSHVITPRLTPVMEGISFFASGIFLLVAYVILIAFYFYKKEKRRALEILSVGLIGVLINYFMKLLYQRPRPSHPLVNPLQTFSFPSGHAMSAFVFYGLLIYLVWKTHLSKPLKWVAAFFMGLLALAIGFSRVYLRVHYASDVIAGFCLGFVWICFAVWLLERVEKKTSMEVSKSNPSTKQTP